MTGASASQTGPLAEGGAASSTASPAKPSVPNAALPHYIVEAVLKMGRVDWGAVGPKSDDEHVVDFRDSLAITREHFELKGPRYLWGVYLEGTETVLCHTGTSPNSPVNAQALCGIWNWLVEQASAIEARSDATPKSGAAEGESAVAESETPNA